jgi:hypothetical protein
MTPGAVKLRESLQQSWRIYVQLSSFISKAEVQTSKTMFPKWSVLFVAMLSSTK